MILPTRKAMSLPLRFAKEDMSGSVPIEYALIASAICLAIAGIVATMGDQLASMWTRVLNAFG
jgi:Flp pilus assembly pilin Flp